MNRRPIVELLSSLERQWPKWFGTEIVETVPILDERDAPPFDTAWMERFEHLETKKQANPLHDEVARAIAALRESAFLFALERWLSHEIAACVSDDMALLGDALALDSRDPWISGLLQNYANGRLPGGEIAIIDGRLRDLAETILE